MAGRVGGHHVAADDSVFRAGRGRQFGDIRHGRVGAVFGARGRGDDQPVIQCLPRLRGAAQPARNLLGCLNAVVVSRGLHIPENLDRIGDANPVAAK